jgi:AcrR family transcriptional regulator
MPRTGLTSEQLKDKAINCAIAQMEQVGFNRVTLSDIAKDLGVSHAALYSHFADKAALFDAVGERWLTKFDLEQDSLCVESKSGDALKRLIKWFVQLHRMKVQKVKDEPELFKAFNNSTQNEKPFVQKHIGTMRRQLSTIVGQAIDSGLIKAQNVDIVVTLLFESTIGFHHPALVAIYVGENREPLLRKLLDTLIDGLRI